MSVKANGWLRTFIYGVLLFLVYRSALDYLFQMWQGENFSYCMLIPPIVLYLLWEKRKALAALPSCPSWAGLVPMLAGIFLYFVGELGAEFTILFISLWLVIVGLTWLHLGLRKLKIISFPLVFGIAAFVPPNALYAPLTFRMKLISSHLGVKMLQLIGMSAYREGNVIDLGFTQLQVVDACSGLRYVIPLFLMGVLLAYYYRAAAWKKTILILSTLPLSIFTNSLRIASVGILYPMLGPKAAEGFFHDFSGWFIFMVSLLFLLLEMWVLKKIFRERGAGGEEQGTESQEQGAGSGERGAESGERDAGSRERGGFFNSTRFIVAVMVLVATVSIARTVNFREKTPLVKPFSGLPLQVGKWTGTRTSMEQRFLDVLKLSDYAMIDYRDERGKEVSLYVAFNSSQQKGEATHSPATCLPGSGWEFRESATTELALAGKDGARIRVSRAFMEKNGARQLVYYWFPQRGRVLTNLYQVKLFNFWDAVTRRRTDGGLVRIITPLAANEEPGEAEERLKRFAGDIVPVIDTFMPK